MKKFFAQLRPLERRLAVGVLVVFILVLNWVFIWPHFSDWSNLRSRLDDARTKLQLYQTTIAQTSNYQAQVKGFESQGEFVAPEDQSINFLRTIQSQAMASGVGLNHRGAVVDAHERRVFRRADSKHQCRRRRTINWWTFFTSSAPTSR